MADLSSNPALSDADCVQECLLGKADSFEILVDRYQKPIFNLCYRMTGSWDDAADLSQEAFLKAYRQLDRYEPNQKFFSWLYTIALNLCRNDLRRKKIVKFLSFERESPDGEKKTTWEPPSPDQSPLDSLESGEKQGLLTQLINRLPERQKSMMLLKYNDHLPDTEIAEILGISVNNLRVQVHQAKQKLFEEYQKGFKNP